MPIIASEVCDHDEANASAVYKVEMKDFLAKQRSTKWGVSARTNSFTVSWSSFRLAPGSRRERGRPGGGKADRAFHIST